MRYLQRIKKYSVKPGIEKPPYLLISQILFVLFFCINIQAQDTGYFNSTGYPRGELPPVFETQPSLEYPEPVLPLKPVPRESGVLDSLPIVVLKKIEIQGSSVFSDQELENLAGPFLNQVLTNDIIENIRHDLTLHYINKGYVNSGAIVPDQTVADGIVVYKIIEGKVTDIDIRGTRWFNKAYIADRLSLDAGPPLDINAVQKRLQMLQQDQRISHIQAELKPGMTLGDSLLDVEVKEAGPYQVQFGFDNYQSPTIGSKRGFATLIHQNVTGHGDILNLNTIVSKENDPQFDIGYCLPITRHDTTLAFRYSTNNLEVQEGIFEDLDITTESETFQVTLRHPFYRTLTREFAMAVTGEHNKNKTYLLGEPYSFSPGAVDGEAKNTVLRFSQEWTQRTQKQVIALLSRFSLGVDALDATRHSADLPDGEFFSWLGQVQWARILPFRDTQLIFRTDLQLSSDSLLSLEKISVGGRHTVRGYRENQMVRDQALISSLEARVPLVRDKGWTEYLQAAAFLDFGEAWNKHSDTPSPRHISSIGLGLRWSGRLMKTPWLIKPRFEIYWGHALTDVSSPGGDLQDDGIHFQLVLQNF